MLRRCASAAKMARPLVVSSWLRRSRPLITASLGIWIQPASSMRSSALYSVPGAQADYTVAERPDLLDDAVAVERLGQHRGQDSGIRARCARVRPSSVPHYAQRYLYVQAIALISGAGPGFAVSTAWHPGVAPASSGSFDEMVPGRPEYYTTCDDP